eukprot:gene29818-12731_t
MAYLRQRFVDLARQYVGVPYGRKFHEAEGCECEGCVESGRQLFQDKFSLDCCGLLTQHKLQPGDLVFYSGVYVNPKSKPHPSKMTHVEIFVGGDSGEATIGSGALAGEESLLQLQPNVDAADMFYCRIDTWLQGACVPEHPDLWKSKAERWKGEWPITHLQWEGMRMQS